MITICLVYFRSLALVNLEASLYSLSRQDFANVEEVVFFDNNTEDATSDVRRMLWKHRLPVRTRMLFDKHGDPSRTHSWSTNRVVEQAFGEVVFFTRADYILDFDVIRRFAEHVGVNKFVTSNAYHLAVDVGRCNETGWRQNGAQLLRALPGTEIDYTAVDTGVWMMPRQEFEMVGGLDEGLTAWGHAQTHFQHKLYRSGVEFVRIPEPLYFHPLHSANRDIDVAHVQLNNLGIDLHEMWARYHGNRIY